MTAGPPQIQAVIVNHNTSPFSELCLRSLFATEGTMKTSLTVTVMDNHSDDDGLAELRHATEEMGADFELSRWPVAAATVNTHGDVLRDFVLARPDPDCYLFLDADIAFTEPETLRTMYTELIGRDDTWAMQARFVSAEGRCEGSSLDLGAGDPQHFFVGFEDPASDRSRTFPIAGTGKARVHPGCCLIRNSPALQETAEAVGFGTAVSMSQDPELAGYFDTMALASAVMATNGLIYGLSSAHVVHYFNVSYDERTDLTASKLQDCCRRLALLRTDPHAVPEPGPWG